MKIIANETQYFLTLHFKPEDLNIKFTEKLTKELYQHLGIKEKADLLIQKNEIRKGFYAFFNVHSQIVILFKELNNIIIRINKELCYTIKLRESINSILQIHRQEILKSKDDESITIEKKPLDKLLELSVDINNCCNIDFYHILKESIVQFFLLSKNDFVFINFDYIKIRFKKKIKGKFRAVDIAGAELAKIEEDFLNNDTQKIIQEVIKALVYEEKIFSLLSPEDFYERHINIVKIAIIKKISEEINSKGFEFVLFANYIFRRYFDFIYKEFSYYLLHHDREYELKKMANYFTGDTVLTSEGKKYKIAAMIDDAGTQWDFSKIKVALRDYYNATKKFDINIKKIQESLIKVNIDLNQLKSEFNFLNEQIRVLENSVFDLEYELKFKNEERYKVELKLKGTFFKKVEFFEAWDELKNDIQYLREKIHHSTKDRDSLTKERFDIKKMMIILEEDKIFKTEQINNYKEEIKTERYKKTLHKYNNVSHALKEALMQRKKFI
jgi:hypothetical protein